MNHLKHTIWNITKASDFHFHEERMVYEPATFLAILAELHERFGSNLIVDFDDHEIIVYDDYIE